MADDNPSAPAPSQPVGWFELFFDLVVVASVNVTNDRYLEHPSASTALIAILGLISLCWVWFLTTTATNVYPVSGALRRGLVLVQMGALILAALAIDYGDPVRMSRGLAVYGLALIISAALFFLGGGGSMRAPLARQAVFVSIGGAICVVAWLVGPELLWPFLVIALVIGIIPGLTVHRAASPPVFVARPDHLRERLGLFILIVLGDGFLLLVQALGTKGSVPNLGVFAMTFIISVSIWALYFEGTFPHSVSMVGMRWRLSLLAHLTLVFGMIATLDCLVLFTAREQDRLGEQHLAYFAGGVTVILLSFAVLGFCSRGRLGLVGMVQVLSGLTVAVAGVAWLPGADVPVYSVMLVAGLIVGANAAFAVWRIRANIPIPQTH